MGHVEVRNPYVASPLISPSKRHKVSSKKTVKMTCHHHSHTSDREWINMETGIERHIDVADRVVNIR